MVWRLEFERRSVKQLRDLPEAVRPRILKARAGLSADPRGAPNVKALVGREGYRLRVGDYRVLYVIEDDVERIRVTTVGHRGRVYE
ncbi:MAG TPA: type II toxin-antitoxin system RelE/ParE family toxin [Caulobacteraceae bacterium]|nr:type II toxin-antitoxin system RelE/ParE family toxin [Caulobacteraceae bacterium]